MATLALRSRAIVVDSWPRIERTADGSRPAIPTDGDVLVPQEVWLAERESLARRPGRVGVWLDPHADLDPIAGDLPRFRMVAVHVPAFTDGRAYSIGYLLRRRHRYAGELRAFGDVRRDQLLHLARCGFDSFELAADQDADEALGGLSDFDQAYQVSWDRELRLRRRPTRVTAEL
jgi:uncharacterized protein (DUF934 family)